MEPTKLDEVKTLLAAGCCSCVTPFDEKSIHILKCGKHAVCKSCCAIQGAAGSLGCYICSMNAAINIPLSGNVESLTSTINNMLLFTQQVATKEEKLGHVQKDGLDFRNGLSTGISASVRPTHDLWLSQDNQHICLLDNKGKPAVTFMDRDLREQFTCIFEDIYSVIAVRALSYKNTAMIIKRSSKIDCQLGIYDFSVLSKSVHKPRLLRLFSTEAPPDPRFIFKYDSSNLGVYSATQPPIITVMNNENYVTLKTIIIQAEYESSNLDSLIVNHGGDFILTSLKSDVVHILNPDGTTKRTIGHRGHGYRDPPGNLWGPTAAMEDDLGNLVIACNDGGLNLYSDDKWSMVKIPEEKGQHQYSLLLCFENIAYLTFGPRGIGATKITKFRVG